MAPPKRLPTPFPRKRFGQHFLEPAWVTKVIRAIDPQATDHFIEIGPGPGAMTRPLLARAADVLAVEIDRDLAAGLRGTDARLTVVEGDFLETADGIADRLVSATRVAGNLPYNVAAPILFKLIDLYAAGRPLVDATLMLQRRSHTGGSEAWIDPSCRLPPSGRPRPPPAARARAGATAG